MRKTLYILLLLAFACSGEHKHDHGHDHDSTGHEHEEHEHGHHHGDANAFMNESEFDELVQRFEDPEREKWQKPEVVIAFIGDLKGKTLVDIGAGTGYFAFKLADGAEKIIAADADARFIDYIENKNKDAKKNNLITRKAEYASAPLEANEADVVLLVNVYHHIEKRNDYFKAVHSKLREKGELIVVDFKKGDLPVGPPNAMKAGPNTAKAELEEAGFTFVQMDDASLEYQYLLKMKK